MQDHRELFFEGGWNNPAQPKKVTVGIGCLFLDVRAGSMGRCN